MAYHTFYLEVTVSARDIDSAAKKLEFIRKRATVESVSCSMAMTMTGNMHFPLARWPFRRWRKDGGIGKRNFDYHVKQEAEKLLKERKCRKNTKSKSSERSALPTTSSSKSKQKTSTKPVKKRRSKPTASQTGKLCKKSTTSKTITRVGSKSSKKKVVKKAKKKTKKKREKSVATR